jgi:hypothetical protein
MSTPSGSDHGSSLMGALVRARKDAPLLPYFALFFLLLLAANAAHLTDPPYWDALMGVYRQGVWLGRHHFGYAQLLREASYTDGGPRVHLLYFFAPVFAALNLALPPAEVFLVLHLTMLGAAALALAVFHRVLRTQVSAEAAAVWIAVAATGPVWAGQTASLYMEMPMSGALALSALALWRGRHRDAALWSIAAYFMKSAALLQAAALFASGALFLALAARRNELPRRGRELLWLLLPLPAMMGLNALASQGATPDPIVLSNAPSYAARFVAQSPYLCPVLIIQTLLLAVAAAAPSVRARLRTLLEERENERWLVFLAVWVLGFWAAYMLVNRSLVRYTVFVHLPTACLLAACLGGRRRFSLALGLLLVVWNLGDLDGRWLPPLPAVIGRSGERLERSREFLSDLRADQELAAVVSRRFPREAVVAHWPFPHILLFPELGYVAEPHPGVIDATRPPLREASALRPSELLGRTTLCVYAPNVFDYSGPSLRPRAGDQIVWADARLPAPLVLYRRTWRSSDFAGAPAS